MRMREAITGVITNFKVFIGSGWLMWGVFCIALVICFFLGSDRRKKLFTVGVLGCVVILNPLVYQVIGTRFMSGVYWRLFWALPIVPVVAVVMTELVGRVKREWLRFGAAVVLALTVAVLGKRVINRGTYTIAENDYQLPQEVIEVSDILLEASGGDCGMVIVPDELVCYIRQYTANIRLAYGRNIWGFINNPVDWQYELYDFMHAEEIDYQNLRDTAVHWEIQYIVFNEEQRELPDNLEEYGYTMVGTAAPYRVYSLKKVE